MYTSSPETFIGVDANQAEVSEPYKFSFPLVALLFVLLMLLLVNVGCAPISISKATPAKVTSGEPLFSDDFSNPPSTWGVWNRGGAIVEYRDGGLRILVKQPQFDYWSVAGQKFTDVRIEVDAIRQDGPEDNDLGIVCRYIDKNNFYMLVISSDGYYGIAKMFQGRYSMIGSDQLQYSDAIARGKVTNHLRADCVGPALSLYDNDQKLIEASDSDFTIGDVGVLAGSYNKPGVDILFDNFVVKKP